MKLLNKFTTIVISIYTVILIAIIVTLVYVMQEQKSQNKTREILTMYMTIDTEIDKSITENLEITDKNIKILFDRDSVIMDWVIEYFQVK